MIRLSNRGPIGPFPSATTVERLMDDSALVFIGHAICAHTLETDLVRYPLFEGRALIKARPT